LAILSLKTASKPIKTASSAPLGMDIDRSLLEKVASVARLKLTEEEITKFLPQLKDSLSAFSEISAIDTEGITPSFHPIPLHNAMREDVPKEPLSQEEALSLTIHKKDGYFKGPRAV
jgi:aspartyl-tRNA(Asn)/glutamyl-tRNA(Gln) amidotransferase subunit C